MADSSSGNTVPQITRKVFGAFSSLVRDELDHVYPRHLGDSRLLNYPELNNLVTFVVSGHDGARYRFPEKKRKVGAFIYLLLGGSWEKNRFMVLKGGFQAAHRTEAFIRMSEAFSLAVGVSKTSHQKILREVVALMKGQTSTGQSA